jgi:hypothetical protein
MKTVNILEFRYHATDSCRRKNRFSSSAVRAQPARFFPMVYRVQHDKPLASPGEYHGPS